MKKLIMAAFALASLAGTQAAMADPCGAVMCMSHNETAPWQCKEHVDSYFNIRVYRSHKKSRIFDPGATAIKRYQEVMDKCDGAKQEDKDKVNAKYGMLEYSPFSFSVQ